MNLQIGIARDVASIYLRAAFDPGGFGYDTLLSGLLFT